MRSSIRAAVLIAAGGLVAGSLLGDPAAAKVEKTKLIAPEMTGAKEVPGPGDPDGSGTARFTFKLNPNKDEGKVCFKIAVADIDLPASAAHIHQGGAAEFNPPLITLKTPNRKGKAKGCVEAGADDINAIIADPAGYYVNVHTTGSSGDFSAGAVRDQLQLAGT